MFTARSPAPDTGFYEVSLNREIRAQLPESVMNAFWLFFFFLWTTFTLGRTGYAFDSVPLVMFLNKDKVCQGKNDPADLRGGNINTSYLLK